MNFKYGIALGIASMVFTFASPTLAATIVKTFAWEGDEWRSAFDGVGYKIEGSFSYDEAAENDGRIDLDELQSFFVKAIEPIDPVYGNRGAWGQYEALGTIDLTGVTLFEYRFFDDSVDSLSETEFFKFRTAIYPYPDSQNASNYHEGLAFNYYDRRPIGRVFESQLQFTWGYPQSSGNRKIDSVVLPADSERIVLAIETNNTPNNTNGTSNNNATVPEPASILGLIALGGLGISSLVKRDG